MFTECQVLEALSYPVELSLHYNPEVGIVKLPLTKLREL